MNKLRILLLIAVGISLLVSLVKAIALRMPSANRTPARKRLADAQWLDDKSTAGSFVKLTGVVRVRDQGERLVAPLSENRCVVVHVRAMVRHGRNPRGKLVDKLDIVPFTIEDAEGKVLVEATHAMLDISPTRESKVAATGLTAARAADGLHLRPALHPSRSETRESWAAPCAAFAS